MHSGLTAPIRALLGNEKPEQRLPRDARAKLDALREERAENNSIMRDISERRDDARREKRRLETRIAEIENRNAPRTCAIPSLRRNAAIWMCTSPSSPG
jgi:hypothetical protein